MSGIADVHPEATLTPTKIELVRAWLPGQPWFTGDAAQVTQLGAFRFVDPAGEVGIETLIVTDGTTTYQVPLTYRDAPLEDAADYLAGEMEHSLLGHRWVYDATGDPEYIDELIRVIREGDTEADLSTGAAHTVTVEGTGMEQVANSTGQVRLHRVIDPEQPSTAQRQASANLMGTWTGADGVQKTTKLADLF